ncbi:hypothetical protein WG915_07670 [Corynebacterium sp. H128]|uniref:hypothetical protein n=1 Tax=Corynebacterium sp. H128 TaxID=3133427 RepID=UPI0030A7500F
MRAPHWLPKIAGIALAGSLTTLPMAGAVPFPLTPANPEIALQWANPEVRTLDTQSLVSSSIDHIEGNTMTVTLVNKSGVALSDVNVRTQRGAPVSSVTAGSSALAADQSYYGIAASFHSLNIDLAPEESYTFTTEIPLEELQLEEPGVYPLLINLNGQLGAGGQQYLTSQRTLFQVGDLPKAKEQSTTPVSMLIPVTGLTNILPGETGEAPNDPPLVLQSEQFAQDLGPDGRLTQLLQAYETNNSSSCLAVDPEVAATAERMSHGYQVAEGRKNPVARKPRLRDSWGSKTEEVPGVPGTGAQDAALWIAQLRGIAREGGCIVPLPWANAELNAVAKTGNNTLMREALTRGENKLNQVLGVPVDSTVIHPGFGYLEDRALHSIDETLTKPTSVLVADNTISAPVTKMSERLTAVGYHSELSALLATIGDTPATAGYANQWERFDYRLDSAVARRTSAAAGVSLAVAESERPLLIVPPPDLQAEDLQALQQRVHQLFDSGRATAISLPEYIAQAPTGAPEVSAAGAANSGSPFADPTVVTDTEILRAGQQAKNIDDLTNLTVPEPTIALTPTGFTNPLRYDILRALSTNARRSIGSYDSRAQLTDEILNRNRDILQQLRASVVLLPPGNVYTRTSESSPLLIVAENGLPLPVDARLGYSGPEGASITVAESLKIPARGSITTQMMADLPETKGRTDLTVWLATPDDTRISVPVEIGVQTRSGVLGKGGIITLLLGALGFAMFHVKRRRSRRI